MTKKSYQTAMEQIVANRRGSLMLLEWIKQKGQVRATEAAEFIRTNIGIEDDVHWRESVTTAMKALGILEKYGQSVGMMYRIAPGADEYVEKLLKTLKGE